MDIKQLKETIVQDVDNIKLILQDIGCDRITKYPNEFRCAKDISDKNPTRVVVKFDDNLTSRIYDLVPVKGDILTLIMELKNCCLSKAIKICCNSIGIKYHSNFEAKTIKRKKAFGGFFSSIKRNKKYKRLDLKYYDDDILNDFINKGNIRFYNDGINYDIQTEFDIMFDDYSERIVVPWRDINSKIVGIMGRYNKDAEYCTKNNISKWLPIENLSFPKSQLLYGLYQNYKYIIQKGRVYVGESEKFVLQACSFGVRNVVAIGSHDISPVQRDILISLKVDIVTCMDNDIPDEFNAKQCNELKSKSCLIGGKVGFVMNDEILKDKESPTDKGLDVWNKCVEDENIFWV